MIRRPSDLWPKCLLDEYRRLAKLPGLPVRFFLDPENPDRFQSRPAVPLRFEKLYTTGQDYAGLVASVCWLAEGPKVVNVTREQYAALSQVEVRLELADVRLPYPSVLVNMPAGVMHEYVLLHLRDEPVLGGQLLIGISGSASHLHDIVTIMRHRPGLLVEEVVGKYHNGVTGPEGDSCHRSLRVALNMLLAMANFGHQATYLFPAEVDEQRRFVAKGNRVYKDGTTPADRLAEQPLLVTLSRDVELYHREGTRIAPGDPTGREMPFHWRRGHWRKARVGAGRTETKLVFVRPCMVRADLMTADPADTTTTYHSP